jgi:hypothetical protein
LDSDAQGPLWAQLWQVWQSPESSHAPPPVVALSGLICYQGTCGHGLERARRALDALDPRGGALGVSRRAARRLSTLGALDAPHRGRRRPLAFGRARARRLPRAIASAIARLG